MAVLIDTDVIVAYEREGAGIERLLGEEERLLSVITVSELLHGVHRAADSRTRVARSAFVEHVLATFDAVPISKTIARVHAEVGADLAARGASIGTHDLWIGASALAHGFGVATLNARDFARIPALRVIAPPP